MAKFLKIDQGTLPHLRQSSLQQLVVAEIFYNFTFLFLFCFIKFQFEN